MVIFLIVILFISITLHECSHGWVAYKLGDPTPKMSGRLTLNPFHHIDPFGTIVLPFLLLLISGGTFSFGYAKPVPINPYYFKNPRRDMMFVGLGGPLANFSLAFILSLFLKSGFLSLHSYILIWGVVINLILAIFNLIPIPPLDGSKIVAYFLPYQIAIKFLKMEMMGFVFIVFLIMAGFFEWFIMPIIKVILSFLGIEGAI
jgi:Zn-dependent protease